MLDFAGKTVLITGGTGSFGNALTEYLLEKNKPKKLIIFSRDEFKQHVMQQRFTDSCLRYFLGDVRDSDRLYRAFDGVDYIFHAAALKHVPAAEYNPFEAVRTNILGAQNIINAAIDQGVKRVIALSTDKAANPINLYGATKLCSDKLFIAGNAYAGSANTRFAVVRYGNVMGSRGSVIPFFRDCSTKGVIPITDPRMTRFWITLPQAVEFVLSCVDTMRGGEVFIPKLPSMRVVDLAEAIAPGCRHKVVGIRPGEKLHEVMIPADEARNTVEYDDRYVILPQFEWWGGQAQKMPADSRAVPDDFAYQSDLNTAWLSVEELRKLADEDA
jgi:UDP-N-acetylglucosamine 4,6-dehydratase